MQSLPQGITGFNFPAKGVRMQRFTVACHTAARQAGGQTQQITTANGPVTPNYHEALITLRHNRPPVRVLCNAHHPIVAFTLPPTSEGSLSLEFADCPPLAEAFAEEFTVLSQQDACAPVTNDMIALLGEDELHEMRYWQPRCIGELIFNFWD